MKPTCLYILLLLFGFSSCLSDESPSLTTESALRHCDCYLVSGTDSGYFQHYQLWDFRDAPVPREFRPFDASSANNKDDYDELNVYNEHNILPLSRSTFANDWKVQSWNRRSITNKPTTVINSADNVFLARDHPSAAAGNNHTYLVLRTTQLQDHNSAAELESRLTNIYRCSLRIRFRILPHGGLVENPTPNPSPKPRPRPKPATAVPAAAKPNPSAPPTGACAGIFTYDPTGAESDIEILTRDPETIIHYANQPDYDPATDTAIPGASTIAALPKPWTQWATHRLDWLRNLSVWSLDGQVQTTNTYRVPEIPSTLVLNLWSDGGEWSGKLGVGESVFLGVEWIQLVYNISDTSGPGRGEKKKADCRRSCWVDDAFRF